MMLSREQFESQLMKAIEGHAGCISAKDMLLAHDAALRAQLANRCDECGAKLNLNGCLVCGAPQCCPKCCRIDYLETHLATLTTAHQQAVESRDFYSEQNGSAMETVGQLSDEVDTLKAQLQAGCAEAVANELDECLSAHDGKPP